MLDANTSAAPRFDLPIGNIQRPQLNEFLSKVYDLGCSDIKFSSTDFVWAEVNRLWQPVSTRRLDDSEVNTILGYLFNQSGQTEIGAGNAIDSRVDAVVSRDRVLSFRLNATGCSVGIPSAVLAATRPMAHVRKMSRWLADYKAPSKVEDHAEIHFQYGCQLAQGAILCEEQGIEIHGLMLSQYDWAGWRLKDDVVVADEELKQLVRNAGNWAWDCVMRNSPPAYIRTPTLPDADAFVEKHSALATRLAQVSALAKAAEERAQELRALLIEGLGGRRLDGHKVVLPGAGALTASQKVDADKVKDALTDEQLALVLKKDGYDEKLMAAHLRSMNVDLKPFRGSKVDADKLAERANEFGIDLEAYLAEQPMFRIEKPIKEEMELYVNTYFPLEVIGTTESDDDGASEDVPDAEEILAEAPRG